MEKDFETVLLLDVYAALLTDKQQRLCDMYYNQDYSLAEIAEIEKTTRQAARDGIAKARQKLRHFEDCLALCDRRNRTLKAAADADSKDIEELRKTMRGIAQIWERTDGI